MICILCGHEDPVEIVRHINEKHEGLEKYFELFPTARVVSNADCLNNVSDQDKMVIATYATLAMPTRSEIYIEE